MKLLSPVSRESNSTTELKLRWMYTAYWAGGSRTAADRMCAVSMGVVCIYTQYVLGYLELELN